MGAIEEKKVEELAALTLLVDRIAKKNAELGFDIKRDFPQLLWVLRDFTLDFETNSAQDYLDKCLEDVPSDKVQTEKDLADLKAKNKLRKQIKTCFNNRICLAFGRPANDEDVLKNIESDDQIKKEFKEDVDNLMKLITLSITPKSANKSFLTGSVFFKFLEGLVSALNSGETPMLNSAIDRLLASETENKTAKVLSSCTQALDAIRERLPLSKGDLARRYNDIVFEHLEILRENIMYIASKDVYNKNVKNFIKTMKERYVELEADNLSLRKKNTANLISTFEAALPQPNLQVGTGFEDFVSSLKPLYSTYFGATANRDTLDWSELSNYLISGLFEQFEGAVSRAIRSFSNQQTILDQSLADEKDTVRRLRLQISELETGMDEMRRGAMLTKERGEMETEGAKDVEIAVLREKLARVETKFEKEKESQNNYKRVNNI
jgi:Guanylate-binding protein, N-terminal domain